MTNVYVVLYSEGHQQMDQAFLKGKIIKILRGKQGKPPAVGPLFVDIWKSAVHSAAF